MVGVILYAVVAFQLVNRQWNSARVLEEPGRSRYDFTHEEPYVAKVLNAAALPTLPEPCSRSLRWCSTRYWRMRISVPLMDRQTV